MLARPNEVPSLSEHMYIYIYIKCSHHVMQYIHYITWHYSTLHCSTVHYTTLHSSPLQCVTLHSSTLHYTTLHYITLHCITVQYSTVPYGTVQYSTVHYITLHTCMKTCLKTRLDAHKCVDFEGRRMFYGRYARLAAHVACPYSKGPQAAMRGLYMYINMSNLCI